MQELDMTGKQKFSGLGIALGAALGAVFGVITGNMGVWLAVGIAIGVALGASMRKKPDCEHCIQTQKAIERKL
jgi:hypothetical protein